MTERADTDGSSRRPNDWRHRALAGMRIGAWLAAWYTVVLTIALPVLNGRRGVAPLSLVTVMIVLWMVGLVGGAIVGVLRPLIHDAYGAALVGALVLAPASCALILVDPPKEWTAGLVFWTAAITFIVGSLFGAAAWFGRERFRANWHC